MGKMKNTLYSFLVINIIWEIAAKILNLSVLPTPIVVYKTLPKLLKLDIGTHIYASLYRIFWGLGISAIVGIILGILIVRVPKIGNLLNPIVYFIYPIPKVALLPIVMLLFGLGELSKVIMLIIAVSFQVIVSVRDQVNQIPEDYYQMLKTLDANPFEVFVNVIWPASLPGVLSALRIALGTSFAILFFTEEYGSELGLGYFIMDQWQRMEYPTMYAGIVVVSLIAYILFEFINILESYSTRWSISNK